MTISNRLKSIKAWLGLLCLGFALFNSACAEDKDAANDSSQHHRHHGGGGGRYGRGEGQGQGGMIDQANPYSSPSPVPESKKFQSAFRNLWPARPIHQKR